MKRIIAVCYIAGFILTASAMAEMLFTAQPVGQGKWTALIGYVDNVNVSNNPGLTGPTPYIHVGYGINNKTDLILQSGVCYVKGLPSPTSLTGSDIGLTLKYQLLDRQNYPFSLAAHATVRLTHYVGGGGLNTDMSGNSSRIGFVVSKVIASFTPYAGASYQFSSLNGITDTIFNPTIGVSANCSKQVAFFIEDTLQMYHSHTGTDYKSNQLAFGVGCTI